MNAPLAPRSFHTTRWSLVRQAASSADPAAAQALSALCEAYWYPVYAFIRRSGKGPHDAEDLTQGFFARLLENEILADADPEKGKLRNFLLTCVRRYLADAHDHAMARKRGARVLVSFNPDWAEQAYATEPVDDLTPDRLFQRRWALTVLEFSFQLLRDEFAAEGKGEIFQTLRPFLGFGPDPEQRYEDISAATGTPIGTLKTQVFRLRQRWRELLFEQVSMTLEAPSPDEVKGELGELLTCV
jgi:RNA polymerase sigma-70 factor (ECF subfamily)